MTMTEEFVADRGQEEAQVKEGLLEECFATSMVTGPSSVPDISLMRRIHHLLAIIPSLCLPGLPNRQWKLRLRAS